MPRMINGVGTRFYGECDWRRDGSFQTTEWLVLMYVPVVPFKSLRGMALLGFLLAAPFLALKFARSRALKDAQARRR